MTAAYRIPVSPRAQTFAISLAGTQYRLTFRWNTPAACWMMSLATDARVPLVSSIPVVTGADLLAPHRHLGIAGAIVVQTSNDADAVPTRANFGSDGCLYFCTDISAPSGRFVLNQSALA